VNERISVTVALNVTVDPQSWYSRFHADPGTDIPDRMLSHLRVLPGVPETGGKVELRRLIRRGSRHCRQSAQHRGVVENSAYKLVFGRTLPGWIDADHLSRLCRRLGAAAQSVRLTLPMFDRRIPNEPSADFL
jgi:hypothetical protein